MESLGCGVLFRILVVDAVDLGGLENDVCGGFIGAERRGGVGGEIGISSTTTKNHYASFLQMPYRSAPDKRLGHLTHLNRRLHAGFHAVMLKGILQRQRVDDGGEHTHVIAGGPVDAGVFTLKSAENIASAHHYYHLDTEILQFHDLIGDIGNGFWANAVTLLASECLTGEFEQNAFVLGFGLAFRCAFQRE